MSARVALALRALCGSYCQSTLSQASLSALGAAGSGYSREESSNYASTSAPSFNAHQYRGISFWRKPSAAVPLSTSEQALQQSEPASATVVTSETDPPEPPAPPACFPLPENSLEAWSAIDGACSAAAKASVALAKAGTWFAPSMFISLLVWTHDITCTPWWLSIMILNLTVRIIALPLMVVSQKATATMVTLNHELLNAKHLHEAAQRAVSPAEHQRLMAAFNAEYTRVTSKHGGVSNAFKGFLPMIGNGIIFISLFSAVSNLMAAKVPGLNFGGALTFSDLTAPDPYYLLPITCTVVTLLNIQYGVGLNAEMGMPPDKAAMSSRMKNLFRVFACLFIPMGGYVPSGIATVWVSNTLFGVAQGMLFRDPRFRRAAGLPTMQELKDMNLNVQAAKAASAPKPHETPLGGATSEPPPPGSPVQLFSSRPPASRTT